LPLQRRNHLSVFQRWSIENVIANDNDLSGMDLKAADMLDLSFLERLEEERKTKAR